MKKIGFGLITLLAANALFAQTSPLSYDYVQASYGTGEIENEDFSSIDVGASYSINETLFVKGTYSEGETDDKFFTGLRFDEIEVSSYDIGVGFHAPVSQTTDFVVSGSYISIDADFGGFSDDGDGFGVDAGFRIKPTEQLEFNAFAGYSEIEDENDIGYLASAYYFFVPTFSLGLIYTDADDLDNIAVSARLHF